MKRTFSLALERIAMKGAQAGWIGLFLVLGYAAHVFAATPQSDPVAREDAADNATVEIDGDVLFRVRGTPSYPADVREVVSRIASKPLQRIRQFAAKTCAW